VTHKSKNKKIKSSYLFLATLKNKINPLMRHSIVKNMIAVSKRNKNSIHHIFMTVTETHSSRLAPPI